MRQTEFEQVLDRAVEILTENVRSSTLYHGPEEFEQGVLDMLRVAARDSGLAVNPTFHKHAFPDIRVNGFGIEVKYTKQDTWLAVGNSIFEGMRDPDVNKIYVVFGKIGGTAEVRWGRYEKSITHVRVSNSPRFVVEMSGERSALFDHLNVTYDEFATLDDKAKMQHVREYSRHRLKDGERLWWLEPSHTVPLHLRPYVKLEDAEKRRLRAEAALLCPHICGPSRGARGQRKYIDAATYLLTYHGVLSYQTRDLFSAGSVAEHVSPLDSNEPYISRALRDIEPLMQEAATRLDGALFEEYWGAWSEGDRITEWLVRADAEAAPKWVPSRYLFRHG